MSYQDQKAETQQEYLGLASQSGARNYMPGGEGPHGQAAQTAKLNPERHRLTHAEAVDRAALLAMFDQLDSRGQKTTLAMLAVAVKLHPRG